MSGIATMTASFVDEVNAIYDDGHDGPVTRPHRYERTRIVDTRKRPPACARSRNTPWSAAEATTTVTGCPTR